jgi:hypothetical protein
VLAPDAAAATVSSPAARGAPAGGAVGGGELDDAPGLF